MTTEQLSQKYSALTGIRANISELILNATTDEEKKKVYDHLMWHIKNGEIRKVDGIKELVAEVLPALAEALSQNSTAEVVEEQTYSAAEAAAYNATLEGAKKAGDVKTPAVEEVLYTAETAAAYNATLEGAKKAGDVQTPAVAAQDAVLYANVDEYNTAKGTQLTPEDFEELDDVDKIKTPAVAAQEEVLYTAETAAAFNATLEGAKEAGDVQTPAVAAVLYTQEEADAFNATLQGAVKAGDTKPNV